MTYKKTTLFIVFLLIASFFASNSVLAASARQYYYSELTSTVSTGSSTYQDALTLSFTPDDNSTYLILSSWTQSGTCNVYPFTSKLKRTTGTAKDFNALYYLTTGSSDDVAVGTIGIDSFGTSPGSQTYKIQHATNDVTSYISPSNTQSSIIALKLSSLDYYAQQEARTTTTSTSFVDKTTLTFTPATAGDYIILASATVDGSSNAYDYKAQLTIDGTAYNTANIEVRDAGNKESWMVMKKVNLTAASHTIKIQYAGESSSKITVGMADARIVALRADEFLENHYLESEARETSTGVIDKPLTPTTQSGDYLVIGSLNSDSSSTSTVACVSLIEYVSSNPQHICYVSKDSTSRGFSSFSVLKRSLSSVSQNWHLMTNGVGLATVGMQNARMIAIELVANGACGTANGAPSYLPPSSNLCSSGTPTTVTTNATTFTWDCVSSGGGSTANCSANQSTRSIPCGTYGDTDSSGSINYYDVVYGTQYLETLPLARIDVDGNSTRTSNDTQLISSYVEGAISDFPVCNIVSGACGTADTYGYPSTDEIDTNAERCSAGTFTSFTDAGSTWTWSCSGSGGGSTANCSALKAICGTSNNKIYATEPLNNFCAYGSESSRTLVSTMWNWTCSNNPGVNASCSTYKTACGSSHGKSFVTSPLTNLCSISTTASAVTTNSTTYDWTCTGDDTVPISCSADRILSEISLLKDINTIGLNSSPYNFAFYNNILYFVGNNGINGNEFWRSDGTEVGTYMVKDIYPGSTSSSTGNFIVSNNILYFQATDGTNGTELWRSDGTEVGTYMVKDIYPGSQPSSMSNFIVLNNILYFRATEGTNGTELWRSDGTEVGTYRVKDINPGSFNSTPTNFAIYNNILYFSAVEGSGAELWRSDGTESGT